MSVELNNLSNHRLESFKLKTLMNAQKQNLDSSTIREGLSFFETVQIAARSEYKQAWRRISSNIHYYPFTSQQRFVIGKILAGEKKAKICENFEKFNLILDHRFILAEIVASKNPKDIAHYIEKFALTRTQRFIIAKSLVEDNAITLLVHIAKFDLTQSQLFEILKLAAPSAGITITKNLLLYHLSQTQKFELAKCLAVEYPNSFLNNLEKFELTHWQFFEIVKLMVASGTEKIVKDLHLHYFNQAERFAIVECMSAKNAAAVLRNLVNLDFTDDQRFELIKIAADKDKSISKDIQQYNLTPKQAYEVAKRAAPLQDRCGLYAKSYQITNEEWLCQLAELEVIEMPFAADWVLQELNLGKKFLNQILFRSNLLCSLSPFSDPKQKNNDSIWIQMMCTLHEIPQMKLLNPQYQEQISDIHFKVEQGLKKYVTMIWPENSTICQKLLELIDFSLNSEQLIHKHKALCWIVNMCALLDLQNVTSEEIEFLMPLLQNLSSFTDASWREKMSYMLIKNFFGKNAHTLKQHFTLLVKQRYRHNGCLLAMLLAPIAASGHLQECEAFLKYFYLNKNSHRIRVQKIIIEFLFYCNKNDLEMKAQVNLLKILTQEIEIEKKKNFLERTKSKQKRLEAKKKIEEQKQLRSLKFMQMLDYATIVNVLMHVERGNHLKTVSHCQDIDKIFKQVYLKILDNFQIKELSKKYANTFGSYRDKKALWMYYAKLSELNSALKKETIPYFHMFVKSVLEGTFKETRYQETEHLKAVFRIRPDLKAVWMQDDVAFGKELLLQPPRDDKYLVKITDHPFEFLYMGEEGHLSCLALDRDAVYNRAIIGHALNGQDKNIIVSLKDDDNGAKLGRALLRLLIDIKTKRPVLYLDTIYCADISSKSIIIRQLVINMAKRYAAKMKVPFVTNIADVSEIIDTTEKGYPNPIQALQSLCPFEYVNAVNFANVSPSSFVIEYCTQII